MISHPWFLWLRAPWASPTARASSDLKILQTTLVPTGSCGLRHVYLQTDTMEGCVQVIGAGVCSLLVKGAQPSQTYLSSLVCSIPHLEAFQSSGSCQTLACIKNHLEGLWEPRFLGLSPRDSDSVRLEWAWECAFLTSPQVMLVIWGLYAENDSGVPQASFLQAQGSWGTGHEVIRESTNCVVGAQSTALISLLDKLPAISAVEILTRDSDFSLSFYLLESGIIAFSLSGIQRTDCRPWPSFPLSILNCIASGLTDFQGQGLT